MKNMVYFLLSISLLKMILGQCYAENPSNVDTCSNKKGDNLYCCYVEYRTDKNANYTTLCLPFNKTEIKKGKHEQTIISIEEGNFTGYYWFQNYTEKFKNYASINTFDCKGTFISKSLFFFTSLLIILLL